MADQKIIDFSCELSTNAYYLYGDMPLSEGVVALFNRQPPTSLLDKEQNTFRSQLAKTDLKKSAINLAAAATLLVVISTVIAIAKRFINRYIKIEKIDELLVSADVYNRICTWNAKTGRKIENTATNYSIFAVSLSGDGEHIALANEDNIAIWSITQKAPLQTLSGCRFRITDLTFSPDGKRLASASLEDTVRIWDIASSQLIRTLKRKNSFFNAVAFSPDGKRIASADTEGALILWDSYQGNIALSSSAHESIITAVAFSPDGKCLASGSYDTKICLWREQQKTYLAGHKRAIVSLTFTSGGKLLASGSDDKTVRIWNIDNRQTIQTLKGHTESIYSAAFYPDGDLLASASADKTIRIWNFTTGQVVRILRGQSRLFGICYIKSHSNV